tara:strand:+ start:361 stop:504 length:144 start_codon:yes stop_codon:yes gene_type:complete
MLISEGSENLCAPSQGKEYCTIEVTITKIGVGSGDSKVIGMEQAVAQ